MLVTTALVLALGSTGPAPVELPAPAEAAWVRTASPRRDGASEPFKFSYTYVELGLGSLDVDNYDKDSDTLYGRASLGLFDFLYVFLDYQNQSTDFEDTDTDLFGLGVGGHIAATERIDFVGEASWLTADVSSDLSNLDDNNDGWTAFAGARWMALPVGNGGLELNGGFRWIDIKGVLSDDEVGAWEAGARYHFLKLFSLGAKYEFLEDDGFWGVDARVSF